MTLYKRGLSCSFAAFWCLPRLTYIEIQKLWRWKKGTEGVVVGHWVFGLGRREWLGWRDARGRAKLISASLWDWDCRNSWFCEVYISAAGVACVGGRLAGFMHGSLWASWCLVLDGAAFPSLPRAPVDMVTRCTSWGLMSVVALLM